MRLFKRWAFVLAIVHLSGCSELPTIPLSSCGNGIVEAQSGEDCDTFPEGLCNPPGSANPCRYHCDPSAASTCPSGWACGSDSVCRAASTRYDTQGAVRTSDSSTTRVYLGDFNGDGYSDVLTASSQAMLVRYFDLASPFSATSDPLQPVQTPALGNFTTGSASSSSEPDTTCDFALIKQEGISVLRGATDRTFLPTPYSSRALSGTQLLVALDAIPDQSTVEGVVSNQGDELVLFSGTQLAPLQGEALAQTLPALDTLLGTVQVADLVVDPLESPCPELALAYQGRSDIILVTPCKCPAAGQCTWNLAQSNPRTLESVKLPAGRTLGSGVIAADLNRDSFVDLLVAEASGVLLVSYGLGTGEFHSGFAVLEADPPDQSFGAIEIPGYPNPGLPLAVGQLNDDKIPDLVLVQRSRSSILVTTASATPTLWTMQETAYRSDVRWSQALIADLNANGIFDVAATSDSALGIDVYNGAGAGRFNHFEVRTEGTASLLRTGDFNGDLILDLAFADRRAGLDDRLFVAFGEAFGAPSSPVSMGSLGTLGQIVPANLSLFNTDAIADIVVASTTTTGLDLSMFQGSSDRRLLSPLFLSADSSSAQALRAVAGQFIPDSEGFLEAALVATDSSSESTVRLWLVPFSEGAAVDVSKVTRSDPLPEGLQASVGLFAAVDLDPAGVDDTQELVILTINSSQAQQGSSGTPGYLALAKASATEGLSRFALLGNPQPTSFFWFPNWFPAEGLYGPGQPPSGTIPPEGGVGPGEDGGLPPEGGEAVEGGAPSMPEGSAPALPEGGTNPPVGLGSGENPGGQIRVEDIDGDGLQDIAATGETMDTSQATRTLVLFRNEGTGTLDYNNRFEVPNPTGQPLQGFVFVQADKDPERELVLLTREAAWIVQLSLPTRTVVDARRLDGVGGGYDAVAADFNRDGVEDLVVVGQTGLQYYPGVALQP